MGAKVGNIGGGMVEILSMSITNATTTKIDRALTDTEKTTLKTECAKYKVVLFCLEGDYNFGSGQKYQMSSGVATGKSIINFFDFHTTKLRSLFVVKSDDPVIMLYAERNGIDKIKAGFEDYQISAANVTLKIYGLIL